MKWTTYSLLLAALGFCLFMAGCATTEPVPIEEPITVVDLEAPTAPAGASDTNQAAQGAEIASLRAENTALDEELARVQAKNRALALETARLREEIVSQPVRPASTSRASTDGDLIIGSSAPERGSSASNGYVVQTASYSNSSKGKRAAKSLCDFFTRKGYTPAVTRESGKYVMVLVGSYTSKEDARAAKSEIALLEYNGRRGDFTSATVRKF